MSDRYKSKITGIKNVTVLSSTSVNVLKSDIIF